MVAQQKHYGVILRTSASLSPEIATVSRDRSGIALAGIIALGIVVLAFLPFYYTNLTLAGGWHDARLSGA